MAFPFFEGVMESVVPGQTRTSPPRDKCRTAVSLSAVREAPAARRLPASTTSPIPLLTGTTAGVAGGVNDRTCGGWEGEFLLASVSGSSFGSGRRFRRTIRRLPAASHV